MMPSSSVTTPVLSLQGVSLDYGAIRALTDVSLELFSGDVIGLVGDNGAGKSTLVKCINGALTSTHGQILIDGHPEDLNANQARRRGVETVPQDLGLVKSLPVWENFFLNRELTYSNLPGRLLQIVDKKSMRSRTHEALTMYGVDPGLVERDVASLSGGQRQIVAVIRAVSSDPRVVMLDEPTAALGIEQSETVLKLVQDLATKGVAVIFVSHNMEHVFRVSSRIVVLRRGAKVADLKTSDATPEEVIAYITGSDQIRGGFA